MGNFPCNWWSPSIIVSEQSRLGSDVSWSTPQGVNSTMPSSRHALFASTKSSPGWFTAYWDDSTSSLVRTNRALGVHLYNTQLRSVNLQCYTGGTENLYRVFCVDSATQRTCSEIFWWDFSGTVAGTDA